MQVSTLDRIIATLSRVNKLTPATEITIEMNPEDVSLQLLREYKQLGINRVSLGVQAFNEKDLKFLGRGHTPQVFFYFL